MLVGLGALAAMPLLAQDQMSADQQRDWFVQLVEGQLSTPERQIRISNIDGALSSEASIREITISDEEGVWLRINNAAIDWDQGALFSGQLLVRELKAESIDYLRNATPSNDPDLPAPEATALSLPQLPVAVQLDKIEVPSVSFGESVFGLGSRISVAGSFSLSDGTLKTALDIVRLDGPGGTLSTRIAYQQADASVDISLTLTEPPDGILANLLSIEGKPDLALHLTGTGPVAGLVTTLTLEAGGQPALEGVATIAPTGEGMTVEARLDGPVAKLMAPAYRRFFGERTILTGKALLPHAGGIEISTLQLSGGQLTLNATGTTTTDGFLRELSLQAAIADADGGSVVLPVPGARMTVESARLRADLGGAGGEGWKVEFSARDFATPDLAARDVSLMATGIAANLDNPTRRRVTFNADGTFAGISASDAKVEAAVGDSAGFGLAGLWDAGGPIRLAEMRLVGKSLQLVLGGTIDNSIFDGRVQLEAPSIAPFSSLAGRNLDGGVWLSATGTISPLTGGFNLTLDGEAENLALSEPALDKVLAGTVSLGGRVSRSERGLEAEAFRLVGDNIRIAADGAFATGGADFDFAATLGDLALLSDRAEGQLELTGSAKGKGAIALDLKAKVEQGRLAGKALAGAGFGFTGNLAETGTLTGALSGDAMLDGFRVSLAGDVVADLESSRLNRLRIDAGPTALSGDLVRSADGLVSGELQFNSSSVTTAAALLLLEATGSASGAIRLVAVDGKQAADITGQVQSLRLEQLVIGSADIKASVGDLFGTASVEGTLAGRDLVTAGYAIDWINGTATQSDGTTSFSIAAALESDSTLAGLGLTPLRLTANGSLAGGVVTLADFEARGSGDLQVRGGGRIPLDGTGIGIDIRGAAPLALGNRLVAERGGQLSGTATLDARVTGSLDAPVFSGTVSTSGASYVDPELNLRLLDITGSASLAGDRLVVDRLTIRLATGGSISVGGSIGLGEGAPADLSVRLDSARYADGNLFVATVSGNLALTGALQASPLLSGTINVERADITVPESFGDDTTLLDAQHLHPTAAAAATLRRATPGGSSSAPQRASVVQLDVNVSAPNQIFIRGRGLDAEVGGSLVLKGSVNDMQPVGGFSLNRGRLAILGQRVTFEQGTVTLVGDLDPFLDFIARTEGDGITVFVRVVGRPSELDISFSSSPALPEDEVLSRLLFKRSIGELTPLQLAKVAGAAAELAGGSSSSLVDSLRAKVGLDDLDVVTGADGGLAVQVGTYVQDNIYLGVQAGADGNSRVTVNLDLTDDVRARASTGTDGETGLGIFYETDY